MRHHYYRLLALAATHGRRVALALALVGLLVAGATAWHVATPSYERVSETTTVDAATANLSTSVLVTGDSPFYTRGTRVESAPVYLRGPAPVMTLRGTAKVPADREVVVSQRIVVSYVATHEETVFWRFNRTIGRERQKVTDGSAQFTESLNVTAVGRRLGTLNDELSGGGTVDAHVVHVTTYRVDGHEHTFRSSAPLRISSNIYTLDGPLTASHEHTTRSTDRRLATTGNFATTVGGQQLVVDDAALAGMLLAALAWAGACATIRYGSRIDPTTARRRVADVRYDEWISAGRLPASHCGPAVRLDSLTDLVDVAIDSDGRVVYDRTKDIYAVFDGERAYYFTDGSGPDWGDTKSSRKSGTNDTDPGETCSVDE